MYEQVASGLQRRVYLEHDAAAAATARRKCKVSIGGAAKLGALAGLGQVKGRAVASLTATHRERHFVEEQVLLPGYVCRGGLTETLFAA